MNEEEKVILGNLLDALWTNGKLEGLLVDTRDNLEAEIFRFVDNVVESRKELHGSTEEGASRMVPAMCQMAQR